MKTKKDEKLDESLSQAFLLAFLMGKKDHGPILTILTKKWQSRHFREEREKYGLN